MLLFHDLLKFYRLILHIYILIFLLQIYEVTITF